MAAKVLKRIQQNTAKKSGKPVFYYIGLVFRYLVLIGIGLILVTPFILAFLGTFKTDAEIMAFPPKFLPAHWLWENWAKTWNTDIGRGGTFPRWLFNTAFLSVTVAGLEVIFCSMAAYAFARMKFPGREFVFSCLPLNIAGGDGSPVRAVAIL